MKTDRFSDNIRRKLESIRPEFTEKDWTRMQASLLQAVPPQPGAPVASQPFSGGVWSGSSWLLAAASVSTVVLVAFSIWQRSEINQLRQAVGQLRQQAVAGQTVPARQRPALTRVDRRNRSLSEPEMVAPATEKQLPGNRDVVSGNSYSALPDSPGKRASEERAVQHPDRLLSQRETIADRAPVSAGVTRPQISLNRTTKTDEYGVSSTSLTSDQPVSSPSVAVSQSTNQPAAGQMEQFTAVKEKGTRQFPVSNPGSETDRRNRSDPDKAGRPLEQRTSPDQHPSETAVDTPVAEEVAARSSNAPADPREAPETYQLAASLPLSLPDRDWNAALVRRAKRMRLVPPLVAAPVARVAVAKTKAPKSQPVTPLAAGFRAGVGGEFDAHLWSAGAFSEIQLSRHWALGVGLSKATYLGGLYITAFDFDNRTKRDFQKEYGRGLDPKLDPKGDILNVDTRIQRFQIPLSVSYRIPLNRTLTLLPTIGTYVNLNSAEKVTCYFRDSPRGFDQGNFTQSRQVNLLNTVTLGTSLEWQSRHWAVQGSPLLSIPITPDPDWQKNPALGFRTRVFYQF